MTEITLEQANKIIDLNYYISFTGLITFVEKLNDVVKNISLDKILVETDSPYLTPVPYRGKRNEPAFVAHVVAALADIRGESVRAVAEATAENAERFYALSEYAAND